jgi:hypothetical protein
MPNRHERRAAEARAKAGASIDKGFAQYRNLYQQAFKKVFEREIAEGYMRGEAAAIDGVEGMILHPVGEKPAAASGTDILLSASYKSQAFKARTAAAHLPALIDIWPQFLQELGGGNTPATGDPRHDARAFIFDIIVGNHWQGDATIATVTGAAIAWLAATSPAGVVLGHSHRGVHYEITDIPTETDGRRRRNFRLVLT